MASWNGETQLYRFTIYIYIYIYITIYIHIYMSLHSMKPYRGITFVVPLTLNLHSIWSPVLSFKSQPVYYG
jgi:hypothetical protein